MGLSLVFGFSTHNNNGLLLFDVAICNKIIDAIVHGANCELVWYALNCMGCNTRMPFFGWVTTLRPIGVTVHKGLLFKGSFSRQIQTLFFKKPKVNVPTLGPIPTRVNAGPSFWRETSHWHNSMSREGSHCENMWIIVPFFSSSSNTLWKRLNSIVLYLKT